MSMVDAASVIRRTRQQAGMSLRELARNAGTSHSAIAAYEAGRRSPTTATLDRIVRAAGFRLETTVSRRSHRDHDDRGVELEAVLELAEEFPARHRAERDKPVFGRRPDASER